MVEKSTIIGICIYVACVVYTIIIILLNLFCTEEIHKLKKKALEKMRALQNTQTEKIARDSMYSSRLKHE